LSQRAALAGAQRQRHHPSPYLIDPLRFVVW
jgi:hypothetical protein